MKSVNQVNEILKLFREKNDFIVCGHINPDGDAISSCFALAIILSNAGKNVKVLLEPYAAKFNVIPGKHLLYTGPLDGLCADVMVLLDCGEPSRLGSFKPIYDNADTTICIDHHMTNIGFANYNYIEKDASSTSELIYNLLSEEYEITTEIASAIYAGIVCDTGGFRFDSATPETLQVAAKLMSLNIPFANIYTEIVHRHSYSEAKTFGKTISLCEQTLNNRIVYSCVDRETMDEIGANSQDMEGAVEFMLNIQDAEVSVLIYEKNKGESKISLRSKKANVGSVASKLGGGGHMLAAGCSKNGEIGDILNDVLALLKQEME